jgi:hypothetical protein
MESVPIKYEDNTKKYSIYDLDFGGRKLIRVNGQMPMFSSPRVGFRGIWRSMKLRGGTGIFFLEDCHWFSPTCQTARYGSGSYAATTTYNSDGSVKMLIQP